MTLQYDDPEAGLFSMAPDSAFELVRGGRAPGRGATWPTSASPGCRSRWRGATSAFPTPCLVRGLSVSQADTTLVLPTEFGIFERLQYDSDLLLAISHGFPEGTRMELVLAAADRNWVTACAAGASTPRG